MTTRSYHQPGLVISGSGTATERQIEDLQHDLRQLGYLRRGIDGSFGPETRRAVMAVRHDLLFNTGRSSGGDGDAPVRVVDYNRGRVTAVNDEVDPPLVECIMEMLRDDAFPKLPRSDDPARENQRVAARIMEMEPSHAPSPFLTAVLTQESGMMHFRVPRGRDSDSFIVVGADTNAREPYAITSRGYGAGQYTLFHHPPRQDEVSGIMLDAVKNVERAARLLREKLDRFVRGPASRADDRIAERGAGPVTLCRYQPDDPRFMRDCVRCASAAGARDLRAGEPLHTGAAGTWRSTRYYSNAGYTSVPRRERFGCDWPYAIRRYNGAGINSYHYQARVLRYLGMQPPWSPSGIASRLRAIINPVPTVSVPVRQPDPDLREVPEPTPRP